ncbi:MAG: MarR family transcriptional regulator [bacterium]
MKQVKPIAKPSKSAAPVAPAARGSDSGETSMFVLIGAAGALEAKIESALGEIGLSMAKYGLLRELAMAETPLTLTDLAGCLSCVRSNMTQLVDRLEADKLVRRVDDPNDRRSVRAELSPLGERREAQGAEILKRVQREFMSSVPAADRAALSRVLSALS